MVTTEPTSSMPRKKEVKEPELSDYKVDDEFLIKLILAETKKLDPQKKGYDLYDHMFKLVCDHGVKCEGELDKPYIKIRDLMDKTKVLDWALFLVEKRYRDHYKHQFNVAALGHFLMNIEISPNLKLFEQITKELQTKRGSDWIDDDTKIAWWIAALLHDHAYPIAYFFESAQKMNFLKERFSSLSGNLEEMQDQLNKAYQDVLCHSLQKLLTKAWFLSTIEPELKKAIELSMIKLKSGSVKATSSSIKISGIIDKNPALIYDHGIISGTNLLLKLEDLGLTITPPIAEAAEAIMLHNPSEAKIDFSKEPIAFLLILCDELQEWGREIVINGKPETELKEIVIRIIGSDSPLKVDNPRLVFGKTLEVIFNYNDDIVEKTHWDLNKFIDSKKKSLNRLEFEKNLNPQEIRLIVNSFVPINLLKS